MAKTLKKTAFWTKIAFLIAGIAGVITNFLPLWLYEMGNEISGSESVAEAGDCSGVIAAAILIVLMGLSLIIKKRIVDVIAGVIGIIISGYYLILGFSANYLAQNSFANRWGDMRGTPGVIMFFVSAGLIFISSILVLAVKQKITDSNVAKG